MSNETSNEKKALEILMEDPCISYNEVSRKTSIQSRRLAILAKENGITRMTRKEYVEQYLKEHPYYTYAIVEKKVKYGQGNIARLAKKCGLSRDPHEMYHLFKEETIEKYKNDKEFNRDEIVEKYGVTLEEVNDITQKWDAQEEKNSKVSHKEKVIGLLKTTELDYTNIANIVGCDLGYVSRLAKTNNLRRDCSFAEALENNINYYLDNDNSLSYEEIRQRLNRCPIDKVMKIAKDKGVERNIVPEEEAIRDAIKNNEDIVDISERYNYASEIIEKVAIKYQLLERDAAKDAKVVEILKRRSTCTYLEISNLLDYNFSLVKAVAEENGFNRATIDFGGKYKQQIIDLLETNPKMTYKEIGKKVNRSQHTVWRIAKENNLGHNKKEKI